MAIVIVVAILKDDNIRKKEHKKQETCQGPEKAVEEWLQQIPGSTSEVSVQKSAVLAKAKDTGQGLQAPRPLVENLSLKEGQTTHGKRVSGIYIHSTNQKAGIKK